MKTFLPKVSEIKRTWHELDASKFSLGRLATRVAILLRGKHKPTFTPHQDAGDYVVVINASKIKLTGRKLSQKKYFRFSGYPGGIRSITLAELLAKSPEKVIWNAVRNMLPVNRLRPRMIKRMHIVAGSGHKFPVKKIKE